MAAAKDIRRDTADVQPNNFVRAGVEDNSVGMAIKAVGEGAIGVDVALAKDRFGQAVETLRSQYLVSSPAASVGQDAAAEGHADDADVGSELTGNDKSSLRDFEKVLKSNDTAVSQGLMSHDAFRLRAERLYRIAISKRPGLAGEFRTVAQTLLGTDVVGASLDIMAAQEAQMMKDGAAKAKSKADVQAENEKLQLARIKDAGIPIPANVNLGDGSIEKYYMDVFPVYAATVQRKTESELASAQVNIADATKSTNLPAQTAAWVAQAGLVRIGVWQGTETILQKLKQDGMEKDPVAVRDALNQGLTSLDKRMAELEGAAAGGQVDSGAVSRQMAMLSATRDQIKGFLDGSDDKSLIENYLAVTKGLKAQSLYTDDEFLTSSVIANAFPAEISGLIFDKLGKSTALMAGRILAKEHKPEAVMGLMTDITGGTIAAVFPRGKGTPPDPRAVEALSVLLATGAESFYMGNDSAFKLENFTGSVAKAGFVQALGSQLKTLEAGMTTEQKERLATAIIGGTANAVRVAGVGLMQEVPSLRTKITFDMTPNDGKIYRAKDGITLSTQESVAVAKYNRAFNVPLINNVVGTLGGMEPEEVWQAVQGSYKPVQEARKEAQKAQVAPESKGSSSGGGKPLTGASTRWWD